MEDIINVFFELMYQLPPHVSTFRGVFYFKMAGYYRCDHKYIPGRSPRAQQSIFIPHISLFIYVIKLVNLLLEVLKEGEPRSPLRILINKIVDKSGGKLTFQDKNRIRNTGNISPEDFKQAIADVVGIQVSDVDVVGPVTGRSPSSLESGFYKSYSFIDPATKKEVSLILTDPSKSQSNKEKQEHSIIGIINSIDGVKTIESANGVVIPNVVKATKSVGKSAAYKAQPYADIDLVIKGSDDPIKISAKGPDVPSAGGAGLLGILALKNPELTAYVKQFYEKVLELALKGNTTDKFVEIPVEYLELLFTGNADMGGPIDYYYKGGLTIDSRVENDVIKLDGNLYTPAEYAKAHTYYFRLAKRRAGGKVTSTTRPGIGIPLIYLDDQGNTNSRLFVTNKRPGNAELMTISTEKS